VLALLEREGRLSCQSLPSVMPELQRLAPNKPALQVLRVSKNHTGKSPRGPSLRSSSWAASLQQTSMNTWCCSLEKRGKGTKLLAKYRTFWLHGLARGSRSPLAAPACHWLMPACCAHPAAGPPGWEGRHPSQCPGPPCYAKLCAATARPSCCPATFKFWISIY